MVVCGAVVVTVIVPVVCPAAMVAGPHVVSAGSEAQVKVTAELKPVPGVRDKFTVPDPPGAVIVTIAKPPLGRLKSGCTVTVIGPEVEVM